MEIIRSTLSPFALSCLTNMNDAVIAVYRLILPYDVHQLSLPLISGWRGPIFPRSAGFLGFSRSDFADSSSGRIAPRGALRRYRKGFSCRRGARLSCLHSRCHISPFARSMLSYFRLRRCQVNCGLQIAALQRRLGLRH